jgi:hypothetical protein
MLFDVKYCQASQVWFLGAGRKVRTEDKQSGIGNKGIRGLEFNAREIGSPRKVILRERGPSSLDLKPNWGQGSFAYMPRYPISTTGM